MCSWRRARPSQLLQAGRCTLQAESRVELYWQAAKLTVACRLSYTTSSPSRPAGADITIVFGYPCVCVSSRQHLKRWFFLENIRWKCFCDLTRDDENSLNTTSGLLFQKSSQIVRTQHALNFSVPAYLSIYNLWSTLLQRTEFCPFKKFGHSEARTLGP